MGSGSLDAQNRAMFEQLAATEQVIAAASRPALAAWLLEVIEQMAWLLTAEEGELAQIGYPELVFHRRLHDRARARIQATRTQLDKSPDEAALKLLARETCSQLAVWLMRHVQDADKLFFPYIDVRYRDT